MADIEKKPAKIRDSKYRARVVRKRGNAIAQAARLVELDAQRRINRYSRSSKLDRYNKDLDLFEKINPSIRDKVIRSRPFGWGNKKLRIDEDGAFVRERGRFRKTRKSLLRDAKSGALVGRHERESFRKKTIENYRDGELISRHVERKDDSYKENWERSEGGQLIRTKYSTSRIRDGGLFRAISEDLSAADDNGYRTLTRQKSGLFKSKKVFETDENGKIQDLVGRQSRTFSKYSIKSKNRDFANVDIRHFGGLFSKSYSSRLDADGNSISKDITARRKLLSKRSREFTEKDESKGQLGGQLKSSSHTIGFSKLNLYKRSVDYTVGDGLKTVKKKLFGLITLKHDTVDLTSSEIAAKNLLKQEAQEHNALWKAELARVEARREEAAREAARKSGITVHPVPPPRTTARLGPSPAAFKPPMQRGQSPFASGVEFPAPPTPFSERGLSAAQSTPQSPAVQNSVKSDNAAILPPEDEEVEFLKSLGSSGKDKTVAAPVNKSADAEINALLAGWKPTEATERGPEDKEKEEFLRQKPIGDNEAEKAKPPSLQSSAKTVAAPVSKSADAEINALLAGWKPSGDNEAEKAKPPSRQNSVRSTSGSSVTLDPDDKDLSKGFTRSQTFQSDSTLVSSGSGDDEKALLNSRAPVAGDASHGNQSDSKGKGKDAAARRGYERNDRESVSLGDW